MAYLAGIWICFAAFAATGLYRLIVLRRIRTELGWLGDASSGEEISGKKNSLNLLKEHKSQFPASRAGSLSQVLFVCQLLATGAATVLIVAAQFQPHSLFHLISAAR